MFELYNYLSKRIREEEASLTQEARSPQSYWRTEGIILGLKEALSKVKTDDNV